MISKVIDWNDEWRSMMKNCADSVVPSSAQRWETAESARRYLHNYGRESAGQIDRVNATLEALPLAPDSRVLEIGAGPGVLTVPIASQVAHVTAVEPSEGMMTVLQEYMKEERVENIRRVQKCWEEVTDEDLETPYDLVLASFSLGMPEIKAAIEKMIAISSGRVCILWYAGKPQIETLYHLVWPHLHETDYSPGPKADVLFNLLYSMEIYPDVRHFDFEQLHVFDSYDQMAEYFQCEHQIPFDPGNPGIRRYLEAYVEKMDGWFVYSEQCPCMMFQWEAQRRL